MNCQKLISLIYELSKTSIRVEQDTILGNNKDVIDDNIRTITSVYSSIKKGISWKDFNKRFEGFKDDSLDYSNYIKFLDIVSDDSTATNDKKNNIKLMEKSKLGFTSDQMKCIQYILEGSFKNGTGSTQFKKYISLDEGKPEWNAIMAKDMSKSKDAIIRLVISTSKWALQPKIDGYRLIMEIVNSKVVACWSPRNMLKMKTTPLSKLITDVEALNLGTCYLDGELGIQADNVKDMFSQMGQYRKDNHVVDKPLYILFDIINSFEDKTIYNDRYNRLKSLKITTETLEIVKCDLVDTLYMFNKLYNEHLDTGYEGIMLRNMADPYIQGRTNRLIKFKPTLDSEFTVIGVEDTFKLIPAQKKVVPCIGALLVESVINGKTIRSRVGSGLSEEQRISWYKDNSLILGREVTIKYQELILDDEVGSLRFPVFKSIRTL